MHNVHFFMIFTEQFGSQPKPDGLVVVVNHLPSGVARVVTEPNCWVALDAFEWFDFSNREAVELAIVNVSPEPFAW